MCHFSYYIETLKLSAITLLCTKVSTFLRPTYAPSYQNSTTKLTGMISRRRTVILPSRCPYVPTFFLLSNQDNGCSGGAFDIEIKTGFNGNQAELWNLRQQLNDISWDICYLFQNIPYNATLCLWRCFWSCAMSGLCRKKTITTNSILISTYLDVLG